MPHTSLAARKRSKNPKTRNSLLDASPFTRNQPATLTQSPFRTASMIPGAPAAIGPVVTTGGTITSTSPAPQQAQLFEQIAQRKLGATAQGTLGPREGPLAALSARQQAQGLLQGTAGVPTPPPVQDPGGEAPGQEVDRPATPEELERMSFMLSNQPGARPAFAQFLGRDMPVSETSATSEAANLLAGSVAENPFISPEGLSMLQRGFAPALNTISSAFWRHTSPVIRQAMLGLLQANPAAPIRPEDVAHFAEATRPT